ncbi:hypothetical protein BJV82DRAFT_271932 [Fennellomyces sp. T-0311]|nr:hypothetical protein BJV82DRAFT_271932 [Fennellomyces sp. T-0311]
MHTCAGDFSKLDMKHPLIALSLQPALVDGYNLEPLLQKCPSIRRLVIKPARPAALDRVLRLCPELEILGYNARTVPELSEEERKTKPAGLRSLRMPLFKRPFDYANIFPLLYKNKETLEDLQANWIIGTGRIKWGLLRFQHTDFSFRKLRKLNVWFGRGTDDIQQLFWRAIRGCATLSDIDVKGALLFPFVNMAIGLPCLKSLRVEAGKGPNLQERYSDLAPLFNASLERFLEQVQLQDTDAVTDGALTALAAVPTLKEITLINCTTVTEKGLGRFFQALGKHKNLAYLELAFMDCAEDRTIWMLATIPNLRVIKLKQLLNITDYGVLDMAKLIAERKSPLQKLEVRGCPGISQAGFDKVKNDILAHATCALLKSA